MPYSVLYNIITNIPDGACFPIVAVAIHGVTSMAGVVA